MLSSLDLDQVHLRIQERLAQAQNAALAHQARAAQSLRAPAHHAHLRPRLAAVLRDLACRLDSSLALPA